MEKTGESRAFGATAVYEWRDEQGELRENSAVLRTTPIAPAPARIWVAVGKALLLLKDLLLPAAVAFLGYFLQRREKDLEDARERERERREDAEKDLARRSDTWNLMLPKVQEYAAKHYMPVAAAIRTFEDCLEEAETEGAQDDAWKRLLWSLLMVQKEMRYLAESIGGLFFRDLDGEQLASACWSEFLKLTQSRLVSRNLAQALDSVTRGESFAAFLKQLEPSDHPVGLGEASVAASLGSLMAPLRGWFDGGKDGIRADLPFLQLFSCILVYESNRPYELWYREPPQISTGNFETALAAIEDRRNALWARLKAYLEKNTQGAEDRRDQTKPPS